MTLRNELKSSAGWEAARANNPTASSLDEICPFTVTVHRGTSSTAKKRKRDSTAASEKYEFAEAGHETEGVWKENAKLETYFNVQPENLWKKMKAYRSLRLNNVKFKVGDHISVTSDAKEDSAEVPRRDALPDRPNPATAGDMWIGRLAQIRAVDGHRVFARISWMYWPSEMERAVWDGPKKVKGKQAYHGRNELIASNHMEIINAVSIQSKVDVRFRLGPNPTQGLYWRQGYDVNTHSLSHLPNICICQRPENPDYAVYQCPVPKCGLRMHVECLKDDVLSRMHAELGETMPPRGGPRKSKSVASSTDLAESTGRASSAARATVYQRIGNAPKITHRGQRRKSVPAEAHEDTVKVELDTEQQPHCWRVEDLRGTLGHQANKTWTESLQCLACRQDFE